MASIRKFKKEVTYLVEEIISDCYLALYFQPQENREAIVGVIRDTVEMNNSLIDAINHPQEKNNPRLLKKYYTQLRTQMLDKTDELFDRLSAACGNPKK